MPRKKNNMDLGIDLGLGNSSRGYKSNMDLGLGKMNFDFNLDFGGGKGKGFSKNDVDAMKKYAKETARFYGDAGRAAGKGIDRVRSRFAKKEYVVLTISGGVTRKQTFSNPRKARAFREKIRQSGGVENVSDVIERRI